MLFRKFTLKDMNRQVINHKVFLPTAAEGAIIIEGGRKIAGNCFWHLLSERMSLRRLFFISVTANGDHTHRRTRGVSDDDGLPLFI